MSKTWLGSLIGLAVLCGTSISHAQTRPLEALRDEAQRRYKDIELAFENDLLECSKKLASIAGGSDLLGADKFRERLASWVEVFPDRLIQTLAKSASANFRAHLAEAIRSRGDASLGQHLAQHLGGDPESDAVLLRLAGDLDAVDATPRIVELATDLSRSAKVRGAALWCLAQLKAAVAPSIARDLSRAADDELRGTALRVLAKTPQLAKDDATTILKAALSDPAVIVRQEALRALGSFPKDHLDALRVLHEAVSGSDMTLVEPALDALETLGNRDTSPNYVFEVVKGTAPENLKERAARLLSLRLQDTRGAKLLSKAAREAADRSPKDTDVQIGTGLELKKYGAYEDAIKYFQRALDRLPDNTQYTARVQIARCHALLGRFEKAYEQLKRDYKDLNKFASEPEFEAMKKDPKYRDLFKE